MHNALEQHKLKIGNLHDILRTLPIFGGILMANYRNIANKKFIKMPDFDKLFFPNFNENVYKVVPTLLEFLGLNMDMHQTLIEMDTYSEIFHANDCFNADIIVNFIVDAFGLDALTQSNFLRKIFDTTSGAILSTIYPPLTVPAITSIMRGAPIEKHGIVSNIFYLREIGSMVNAIYGNRYFSKCKDELFHEGHNPKQFNWAVDPFEKLIDIGGVHKFILYDDIASIGLFKFFVNEEDFIGIYSMIDRFSQLLRVIKYYQGKKLFVNVYFGIIDYLGHRYTYNSFEVREAISLIEKWLQWFIDNIPSNLAKRTVISLIADHGHNVLNKKLEILLTRDEYNSLMKNLRTIPSKNERFWAFYVKEGKIDAVRRMLEEKIGELGLVFDFNFLKEHLLSEKNEHITEVRSRFGDLFISFIDGAYMKVERKSPTHSSKYNIPKVADHGSLTIDELAVPFFATNLALLK